MPHSRCERFAPLLMPYAERELPFGTMLLVGWHLRTCPHCTSVLAEQRTFDSILRAATPFGAEVPRAVGIGRRSPVSLALASAVLLSLLAMTLLPMRHRPAIERPSTVAQQQKNEDDPPSPPRRNEVSPRPLSQSWERGKRVVATAQPKHKGVEVHSPHRRGHHRPFARRVAANGHITSSHRVSPVPVPPREVLILIALAPSAPDEDEPTESLYIEAHLPTPDDPPASRL